MYRQVTLARLAAVLLAWALVMLVVPALLALPVAVGHAQFHAILALAALVPAIVTALRRRAQPTMASTAPIVGLATFALAQLVESVGGLGYGPDNDVRANGLVAFHDLGLAITPIGLAAALGGVVAGIGVLVGRRSRRPALAVAISMLILVAGGIGVAKLIGM
jgi:hypothetical protein